MLSSYHPRRLISVEPSSLTAGEAYRVPLPSTACTLGSAPVNVNLPSTSSAPTMGVGLAQKREKSCHGIQSNASFFFEYNLGQVFNCPCIVQSFKATCHSTIPPSRSDASTNDKYSSHSSGCFCSPRFESMERDGSRAGRQAQYRLHHGR